MRSLGRGRVRRATLAATWGLCLSMGVASCSASHPSGKESERKPYVRADEVCDGLFVGRLAGMVEDVTGHKIFSGASNGMKDVVESLKTGYASGHLWAAGDTLCRLSPKGARPTDVSGEVAFSMYHPADLEEEAPSSAIKRYGMGKIATSGQGGASLYFECVTPKLQGSEESPLRIAGGFIRGKSSVPDTSEYRDAKMIILHAMSLMVTEKLECENNAGLPETPVLTPSS